MDNYETVTESVAAFADIRETTVSHIAMDEFDYSVQISELDWNTFILECEECDLLPPALASSDGSGVSDVDDVDSPPSQKDISGDTAFDGPPDSEDPLMDCYISVGNPRDPEDVLSGSEEDAPLEVVNRFFERLKSLASEEEPTGSSPNMETTGTGQRAVSPVENYSAGCSVTIHSTESLRGQFASESTGCKEITYPRNLTSEEGKEAYLSTPKETEGRKTMVEPSQNTDSPVMLGIRKERPEDAKIHGYDSKPRWREAKKREKRVQKPLLKPPISSKTDSQTNVDLNTIEDTPTTTDNVSIRSSRLDEESRLFSLDSSELQSKNSAAESVRSTSEADLDLSTGTEDKKSEKGVTETNQNRGTSNTKMSPNGQKSVTGVSSITEFSVRERVDIHGMESLLRNKICPLPQSDEKNDTVEQDFRCEDEGRDCLHNQALQHDHLYKEDNLSSGMECTFAEAKETSKRAILESFELALSNVISNKIKYFMREHEENQETDRAKNFPIATVESGNVQSNGEDQNRSESGFFLENADVSKGLTSSELNNLAVESKLFKDKMQNNLHQSSIYFSKGSTEFASTSDSIASFSAQESASAILSNKTTFNHSKNEDGKICCKELQKVAESKCVEAGMSGAEIEEAGVVAFKPTEPSAEFSNVFEKLPSEMESDTSDVQPHNPKQTYISSINEELESAHLLKNVQKSNVMESKSGNSPQTINDSSLTSPEVENNTIHILDDHLDSQSKHAFKEDAANVPIMNRFTYSDSPESADESLRAGDLLSVESTSETYTDQNIPLIHACKCKTDKKNNQMCLNNSQSSACVSELKTDSYKHTKTCSVQERDVAPVPELNRCAEENACLCSATVCEQKAHEEEMGDVLEPSRPVYAISSFWDEMEKLTINDILQLRLVVNAHSPGLPSDLQDDTMTLASGAADSGFFTQLEDSKPNHSSGNISTLSDFEEEFSPVHSLSATAIPDLQVLESQNQNSFDPNKSQDVLWESGIDPMLDLEDGLVTHSNDICKQSMFLGNTQKYTTGMHKTVSVKNLTGLETECHMGFGSWAPSLKAIGMDEKQSVHTMTEDIMPAAIKSNPTTTGAPFSRTVNENSTISFPEMFEYFFAENETEDRLFDKRSSHSFLSYGDSVPETYDYFFLEFEAGNFFLPKIRCGGVTEDDPATVSPPSCSTSRNFQFSKEYDFFFPDESPVVSDKDEDDEPAPIRVITRSERRATKSPTIAAEPDMYEDFFGDSDCSEDLFWRNPFSLRRVCLPGLRGPRKRSTNHTGKSQSKNSGRQGCTHSPPHIYQLETWVFRMMEDLQQRHADLQTALIDPRRDISYLSVRQSDMCLICIAFASWVLRSANPQALDTWKAALLANISALSAIRYLRRYLREEASREKLGRELKNLTLFLL